MRLVGTLKEYLDSKDVKQLSNNVNISKNNQPYVKPNATIYDASDKVVGKGMGNTTNLAAGAIRTIEVICLDIYNSSRYYVEVTDYNF